MKASEKLCSKQKYGDAGQRSRHQYHRPSQPYVNPYKLLPSIQSNPFKTLPENGDEQPNKPCADNPYINLSNVKRKAENSGNVNFDEAYNNCAGRCGKMLWECKFTCGNRDNYYHSGESKPDDTSGNSCKTHHNKPRNAENKFNIHAPAAPVIPGGKNQCITQGDIERRPENSGNINIDAKYNNCAGRCGRMLWECRFTCGGQNSYPKPASSCLGANGYRKLSKQPPNATETQAKACEGRFGRAENGCKQTCTQREEQSMKSGKGCCCKEMNECNSRFGKSLLQSEAKCMPPEEDVTLTGKGGTQIDECRPTGGKPPNTCTTPRNSCDSFLNECSKDGQDDGTKPQNVSKRRLKEYAKAQAGCATWHTVYTKPQNDCKPYKNEGPKGQDTSEKTSEGCEKEQSDCKEAQNECSGEENDSPTECICAQDTCDKQCQNIPSECQEHECQCAFAQAEDAFTQQRNACDKPPTITTATESNSCCTEPCTASSNECPNPYSNLSKKSDELVGRKDGKCGQFFKATSAALRFGIGNKSFKSDRLPRNAESQPHNSVRIRLNAY